MKVSIIIPVYNVEKYIERCINSVIKQSFTDLECILIDDCCTDNSMNICQNIINKYNGPISFIILKHNHSEGPSSARNTGTNIANGEYIFYLDSDDEITHDCISLLYNKVTKYPEVEIVQGCTIAEKNKEYYSLNRYEKIESINDNNWIQQEFFNIEKSFPVDVWNKLIRKDFIKKHNIRFKDGIIHEDQLWSYDVMTKLQSICFVHSKTYIHYSVPMSIMTSLSIERSYKSWGIILEDIASKMEEPFLELQIRKYLLEYIEKYEYFKNEKIHPSLINEFIKQAKRCKRNKLAIALYFYNLLNRHQCGMSIKQWISTYCRYNITNNLRKEIISDCIALISNKYK